MLHFYKCEYEKIKLIPMSLQASQEYRKLRNQAEIRKWFGTDTIISEESQALWYESYLHNKEELMFSVMLSDDCFIGGCSLYHINDREAEFGRLIIDPQYSGNHYGKDSVLATLKIAKHLALQRVYLEVFEDNTAAIRTYSMAGFKDTGVIKKANSKTMKRMQVEI